MEITEKNKVGETVAENFHTARVFTKYGIDFCCKGGMSIEAACEKRGIAANDVINDLKAVFKTNETPDFLSLSAGQLIQQIVSVHHEYIREVTPALTAYLEKVARVHGPHYPELLEIRDEFMECADVLASHMMKEEHILFPYILEMQNAVNEGTVPSESHFGHVDNPIRMMEHEHDVEGERFRKIAALSSDYTPPQGACQTYRTAYAMLKEFEEDLHTHIHLENNILFPRAKKMYEQLFSKIAQ